jgi:DNA-binding IclR family transcriptional regulator
MIKSLKRALSVLEAVARNPESPRSLRELATETEMNPATCAHILKTLLLAGYVEQAGRRQGYTLGWKAYRLVARGPYRKDLLRAAEPVMRHLATETGGTTVLAVLRNGRRITIAEAESEAMVRVRIEAFREDDPYMSATGRVLLAAMRSEDIESFLRESGMPGPRWPEANGEQQLHAALHRIKEEGFSDVSRGDVIGMACPVREGDEVVAALGVFLPASAMTDVRRKEIKGLLEKAAVKIGEALEGGQRNELARS